MVVRNVVQRNTYYDSVALMRAATRLTDRPGIETASLVMGTEPNQQVLATAGLLTGDGRTARPNDLIVAVRGTPEAAAAALDATASLLESSQGPESAGPGAADTVDVPRSIAGAPEGTRLALISTPGRYAAAEALKALRCGMHAFVFSDNVPLADEIALKREAHRRGLLVLGPDCGTAVLDGIPLGFANTVRRGRIGLIGASGTGLQQISTLLHAAGEGTSQIIGVGGRDLSGPVGGISMLDALDLLAADPGTDVVVLVSKPPSPDVARTLLDRAATCGTPVVAAFLGSDTAPPAPSVTLAPTLRDAATAAVRLVGGTAPDPQEDPRPAPTAPTPRRRLLRALYAGGTFAHEARLLLPPVTTSAAPYVPGACPELPDRHTVLDLGGDAYTAGRPHPMIDPTVRTAYLRAALDDPATAVVVLDVVLGHGAAADPAGALAAVLEEHRDTAPDPGPVVIAFVVGTPDDPQNLHAQERTLRAAGVLVTDSSTTAARTAARLLADAAQPATAPPAPDAPGSTVPARTGGHA